jgi:cob(I)alamin adenosyltransferase
MTDVRPRKLSFPPQRRLIQVYTGSGKGKTTAALGQAIRACGHGFSVLMIQFMKKHPHSGENLASRWIPGFSLVQSGTSEFVKKDRIREKDRKEARSGMETALRAVTEGRVDMIILDEIATAVEYGLVDVDDVLEVIRTNPGSIEWILTGRNAHPDLIAAADLVSEIREVKHPFAMGIGPREGIEY